MNLVELFCEVDDFCHEFMPIFKQHLLENRQRDRPGRLSLSEIMTIMIHFHQSNYRTFKSYYLNHVTQQLSREFPNLVSYPRFVALMPRTFVPLCAFLTSRFGSCSGISFIDSTAIAVCHPKRINRHRVFQGLAARGKTSMGWFYGFKLHLITNDSGELLACQLTPGNIDDRKPVLSLTESLWGKLFGDKGYLSKPLADQLKARDLQLFTRYRKNMKPPLMKMTDKLLLRKRAIIETIIDQLKNISHIEHTRHRSPVNGMLNIICGLIAYCFQPKKPSLDLNLDGEALKLIHN